MQWGDQDDHDDEKEIPQQQKWRSAPDKDGICTITEYKTESDGRKVKITRKVKETRSLVRTSKHVLARRKLPKFGDCEGIPPGIEKNVTYHANDNIRLNLKPRKREDDQDEEEDDPLAKLKGKSDSIVVCRNCGETGHWTLKCPKRGSIEVTIKGRQVEGSSAPSTGDLRQAERAAGGGGAGGKYVPMHLRAGASGGGTTMGGRGGGGGREGEENTLRVTNISEDTDEDDLRDLFRRFGHTTRIYLAKDRVTQVSRGFAFISYADRDSAERAIEKLNGYGYDNLILCVEFAKPREENPNKDQDKNAGSQGAGFGRSGWSMQGTR